MKNDVIKLLNENKYDHLISLSPKTKKILTTLISLSYDKSAPLAWRAMEAIGIVTGKVSGTDPELVRNIVNRLLWMIRDESGGIGWSAPESLGEIVRNSPELCADIAPVIVSFHDEPPLTAGVFRAVGRIGKRNSDMAVPAVIAALTHLKSSDPSVRGHAAWALGEIGATAVREELEKLVNDNDTFKFYEDGELKEKTVGKVADKALDKLG